MILSSDFTQIQTELLKKKRKQLKPRQLASEMKGIKIESI